MHYAVTLAEASSVFSVSAPFMTTIAGNAVSGEEETKCTGTGNGGEVDCVQEAEASSAGGTVQTGTISFVATTSPGFTITGTQAVPTTATNGAPATAKNSASHIMVSLTSTSIVGLMGFAYAIFYNFY